MKRLSPLLTDKRWVSTAARETKQCVGPECHSTVYTQDNYQALMLVKELAKKRRQNAPTRGLGPDLHRPWPFRGFMVHQPASL